MTTTIGFDKKSVNHSLLLGLPFEEASGLLTQDVAKPHHEDMDLVGAPTWASLANGLGVLDFNGATDYIECLAADTTDLDFMSGDYSLAVWVNHGVAGAMVPKIVVGRYYIEEFPGVLANNVGWEVYLETNGPDYLELRHHHGSFGDWANQRDGCYSTGWATGVWNLLGITRNGLWPQHYRDGAPVAMTYGANGMRDPDTANRDLVIGARCTKDQDWYLDKMWNLRIWDRELSVDEMRFIFECERHWFAS